METQLKGVSKVISGIAKGIEKESKQQLKYTKQEMEVIELLKQKDIEIEEISIKKKDR